MSRPLDAAGKGAGWRRAAGYQSALLLCGGAPPVQPALPKPARTLKLVYLTKAVPGRFESGFPGVTNRQSLGAIRFAEERHAQGLFIGFARACDRSG
jgi:hypothetical protein